MRTKIKSLSQEIGTMVEKRIRLEILKEQAARLNKELTALNKEIARLEIGEVKKRPLAKVVKIRRGGRRRGEKSVKELIVEVLKRAKRPMKPKELTEKVIALGFRSTRKEPSRTVDSALRANPHLFRKVAPGTFELIKG
ncbi:MAG: HTH domain-containing protein [candidate division WOR-3 bacterium]